MPPPALVLVPGGGHLGSAYWRLTTHLTTQHSYECTTVDLPSNTITLRASSSSSSSSSSDDADSNDTFPHDVAAVRAAITSYTTQGKNVAVLMHSYGGLPGSTACHDLTIATATPGVSHVIYLAALLLPQHTTALDLTGGSIPPHMQLSPDEKLFEPKDWRGMLFDEGSMSEEDWGWLRERMRPMALGAFRGRVEGEPWREVGCRGVYIIPKQDNSLPVEMQRMLIQQAQGILDADGKGKKLEVIEIEGGHEPFVGRVEMFSEVLRWVLEG